MWEDYQFTQEAFRKTAAGIMYMRYTAHKTNSIIGLCKVTNTCVFFKTVQKMSSSLFFLAVSHSRERLIQSRKLLAAPRASYETEDIHTHFE